MFSYLPLVPIEISTCVSLLWESMTCSNTCLSFQSWGQQFALCSLTDPRRVVEFSFSVAFYLLLRWSSDFQVPYKWDWKSEVTTSL